MEVLIPLLLFVGLLVVIIGAIQGILALRRLHAVVRRLNAVESELRQLRADRGASPAATDAPVAVTAPGGSTSIPRALPVAELRAAPPVVESEPAPVVSVPSSPSPPPRPPLPALPRLPAPSSAAMAPEASSPMPAAPPPIPVVARSAPPASLDSVEKALGLRWLTWVGVGLLFLGVAFFLKYAYDRDWLGRYFGPPMRIATATGAAGLLLFLGWRNLRGGLTALGQGLLGGGQALLYLTVFAAFQPAVMVVDTPLLGPTAAFALMALVTAFGFAMAVRQDAIAMAVLALLGGFATPVLIHTGNDARDALCAYLLLLDLGVLGVASYRRWRALDLLAFVGTGLLFLGWWVTWHREHPQPDATLVWVVVFHLVFLVLPFAQHWRRRTPVTVERFGLALTNLAATLAFTTAVLREPAPGLLAGGYVVGAALYAVLGVLTARRIAGDVRARDGFLALAVLLLTLALFFLLPTNAIAMAWVGEAVVLLWLGYRFAHRRTRTVAFGVMLVAIVRALVVHAAVPPYAAALGWNEWFVTLATTGLGMFAFAAVHRRLATGTDERDLGRGVAIVGGLWLCGVAAGEVLRHAHGHPDAWTTVVPALAVAWLQLAGALGFLAAARRASTPATFRAAMLPLAAATIAVAVAYSSYPDTAWAVLNGQCLTGIGVLGVLLLGARLVPPGDHAASQRATLLGTAQLALTALATVETAAFVQRGGEPPSPTTVGQALAWVWLALAVGGIALATARPQRRVLALAAVPLGCAVVDAFWLFGERHDAYRLVVNQRYLFAALTSAAVAGMKPPLARLASKVAADRATAAALALWLLWSSCEAVRWGTATQTGAAIAGWITWLLGVVAVLGAAGACWSAQRIDNRPLRSVGLVALTFALILPLAAYVPDWPATLMLLNPRTALVAAAVATTVWWARRSAEFASLRHVALAVALLGLTVEPPTWLLDHIEDPGEARRSALFSVTVTWLVEATTLLVLGFARDRRSLRLTALGLFLLTAAKLLLVDMSGAQQLYRILAFLLVGVVFVGASWVYHRAERRLAASRANDADA